MAYIWATIVIMLLNLLLKTYHGRNRMLNVRLTNETTTLPAFPPSHTLGL